MSYPDKRPPAGFRIAPELAEADPVVSRDGRTYTFTIRKDARFSSGAAVTARDVVHSLERILTPVMQSDQVDLFLDIVGARKMLDGKATRLAGAVAKGRTLIVRLKKPIVDLPARMGFCVVPAALPADPEGAKAPLPSPAPYYVAKYVPNQSLVLERNRFYRGPRPHHVDRIVADLSSDPNAIVDAIASGNLDWGWAPSPLFQRGTELAQRYGVNKSQFFVAPGSFVRMFVLNVSRPLFKNNPKLRQAVNFAVNRKALTRELGAFSGTPTDQYLRISDERIYPLAGPDLRTARKLAKGRTRGGKAVLYTRSDPPEVAQAQVLQQNLKAIGLEVEIKSFPGSAYCSRSWQPAASRSTLAASAGGSSKARPTRPFSTTSSTGGGSANRTTAIGRTSTRPSTTASSTKLRASPAPSATGFMVSSTCRSRRTLRPRSPLRSSTTSRSSPQGSAASSSTRSST